MSPTPRRPTSPTPRRPTLSGPAPLGAVALLVALLAVGCGRGEDPVDGLESGQGPPPVEAMPSVGPVPDPAFDGPALEVIACEPDPERPGRDLRVEVVLTNTSEEMWRMPEPTWSIVEGDGSVDEQDEMINGPDLGPGSRVRLEETGRSEDPSRADCDVQAPQFESASPRDDAPLLPPELVELRACKADDFLSVRNPFDETLAVWLAVEHYDEDGFALRLHEQPGLEPRGGFVPEVELVEPGETRTFDNTSLAADPAACRVVDARGFLDPPPDRGEPGEGGSSADAP